MPPLSLPLISPRLSRFASFRNNVLKYSSPSTSRHVRSSSLRLLSNRKVFLPRTYSSITPSAMDMEGYSIEPYLADKPPTVVRLEIEKHFEALNDKQKRYAHSISKAALAGTRIVLRQLSPESEPIYDLIITLHKSCDGDWTGLAQKAGVQESELNRFLEYAAMFLGNNGNYKSFGDSKFIPRCTEATVAALVATSPEASKFYEATKGAIFSSEDLAAMHLGYPEAGHMSAYYLGANGITIQEIGAVAVWMEDKGLLPENTRLSKDADGNFEILIASSVTTVPEDGGDIGKSTQFFLKNGLLQGKTITLRYGDYTNEMKSIVAYMHQAAANSDNDNQKKMHSAYAKSFESGSLQAFKDSQRWWIKDKGPAVESNIGFIETYRDPAGIRGEWEGFVSVVNQERTRAFGDLVAASPTLIPLLPWGPEFEKDKFLSPDFTSLEVMTFAGSGIPIGINIPNYDDIRQTEGFKNVSLGNVLGAKAPNEKIPFIREEDLDVYRANRDEATEVQVGLHELTGHGCGKLLQEVSEGVFNFDQANPPLSPITERPIETWYRPGQTWGSVFGSTAATYEECRAELVAMYLSCEFSVLKIFGFGDGTEDIDGKAGDVLYTAYLSMARAGLTALEMWDPKYRIWGQAHSQARFAILKCFLEAGDDFCTLRYMRGDLSDLTIQIDRSKILTTGRKAVAAFLQKLHIYKSTANVVQGLNLYNEMSSVDPGFWGTMVRGVVMANKQPRKVFIQANTTLDEATGGVTIKHYEATPQGMIQSWADRDL